MLDTQGKEHVVIVGYKAATITHEFKWFMDGHTDGFVTVVEPIDLEPKSNVAYIISITQDKEERKRVINQLQGHAFATFVHDSVVTHGECTIGEGAFIGPNSSIFFGATIGPHCIIGPYSMVSHRAKLGTSTMLHPGTMIAGSTTIGDYCMFGMRSTVLDKLTICDDVFVGASSLVSKNIDVPGNYVGYPCRKVP
jgi:carbonic anhydrase/acetyltransferase-like protein (isoleucine patch superfamily)